MDCRIIVITPVRSDEVLAGSCTIVTSVSDDSIAVCVYLDIREVLLALSK